MPYGHLPYVHLPEDRRRGAQRPHRSDLRRGGRGHPALRVAPRGRCRTRNLKPEETNAMPTPHPQLTEEQIESLGRELDELRNRTLADLGERDADYIRNVIRWQRGLEIAGRGLLFAGVLPPAWFAGVTALSLSKILDNMEIGHNVMH